MKVNISSCLKGDFSLKDIKFKLESGEILGVIGNSGSGKTTLIKSLMGNYKFKGEVSLGGTVINNLTTLEKSQHISYALQENSETNLTVFENCISGRSPFMNWRESEEDKSIVEEILRDLNLIKFRDRAVSSLSRGERKRVNIARALSKDAPVIIIDDLTDNLDMKNALDILLALKCRVKKQNIKTIVVINDLSLASSFCDKFLFLKDGNQIKFGGIELINSKSISDLLEIKIKVEKKNEKNYVRLVV